MMGKATRIAQNQAPITVLSLSLSLSLFLCIYERKRKCVCVCVFKPLSPAFLPPVPLHDYHRRSSYHLLLFITNKNTARIHVMCHFLQS